MAKEDVQTLIKRLDQVLEDGVIDEQEFREFEFLMLESLRFILKILTEKK
ncbi:MAG: hypothetical protein ACFFDP_06870 [Promethearchaeota archaeon]